MDASEAYAAATSGQLVWQTENMRDIIPLYSPRMWDDSSSIDHTDPIAFSNTPDAIMNPSMISGSAIHVPGAHVLGIMESIGWKLKPSDVQDSSTVTTTGEQFPSQKQTSTFKLHIFGLSQTLSIVIIICSAAAVFLVRC